MVVTGAVLVGAAPSQAATIKVTSTTDDFGSAPGCSLREAVYSANTDTAFGECTAGSGADDVRLAKGSVYSRSIDGLGEDGDATGDIDVSSEMSIGPKKGNATIDATGFDRVIDVLDGADLSLSRVTLTGALETYPAALVDGMGARVAGRLETSKVKITGNRTLGNSSNNGGGLVIQGFGVAKLDRTTIKGNEAGNVGGGISMYAGTLKMKRSTVAGNKSGYVGGGIYLGGSSGLPDVIDIKDSTISGNTAGSNGGGTYFGLYGQEDGEFAKFTNVTLSGNSAADYGGGAYSYVGDATFNASTITANTADADVNGGGPFGGGLVGSGILFRNSIVAGNFDLDPTSPMPDCYLVTSLGHNVLGKGGGCTKTTGDTTKNPKLKALAKNGGPTATHAIKKGSSAIGRAEAKTAPGKDQRGVKRDKHPDSGAYERTK